MQLRKKRNAQSVTAEHFKELLGLPADAILTGVEWRPATEEIKVYYATASAPLVEEGAMIHTARRRFTWGEKP